MRAMTSGSPDVIEYASRSTVAAVTALYDFWDERNTAVSVRPLPKEEMALRDTAAAEAAAVIAAGLDTARSHMVEALSSVAPEAALHVLGSPKEPRLIDPSLVQPSGVSRFAWLLATTGQGSGTALSDWNHYAESCQLWLAEVDAAKMVRSLNDSVLTGIANWAEMARVLPTSTRLRWASDLLCAGIGEWADASGNQALRPFSSSSMRALNASVARLFAQSNMLADESTFSGIDARLLTWMTAKPARNGPADFERRLFSTDPDTQPLVTLGGALQPLNGRALGFEREIAVLAAMRNYVGSREQGRAYEEARVSLFEAVGPADVKAYSGRRIGWPGTSEKKGHEVDLVLTGEDLLVVGETKAYIPARHGLGVSASYEDQLLKSVSQVHTRIAALEAGQVVLGSPPVAVNVSNRLGLSVPLHDYGSTVWRGDALTQSTAHPCVVMPAHAFALAMSCLRNADDIAGYLHMRLSLTISFLAGVDELEPLLRWLDGGFAEGEIPSTEPEAGPMIRLAELDPGLALYHPPPSDRDLWIEEIYTACNPIHGDSLWDWGSSHPGEVLGRLHTHIIERLENGGIVNLARAATQQVWNELLSIPPLQSAAIETSLDAAVTVLQTHHISADSIPRPSTDATEVAWKERAARNLLVEALERTSTSTPWWKPSTWRRTKQRSAPTSPTGRTPREAFELILTLTDLARRSLH
jgi:hypothetical protein